MGGTDDARADTDDDVYELYYWPVIPGRGEIVRLVLEDAGAVYRDVARRPEEQGGGFPAVVGARRGALGGLRPFAPPVLRHGELVIAQTLAILQYLGPRHGLAPADEAGRIHTLQLGLTWMDLLIEAHDTHHPIGTALYYEDQKDAAREAARVFRTERLPGWLDYFEAVLDANGTGWHLRDRATTADLVAFFVLDGLAYAFPRAWEALAPDHPRLAALRDRVAERPGIAAYLASDRRIPFNEDGIFRRYPELDPPAE